MIFLIVYLLFVAFYMLLSALFFPLPFMDSEQTYRYHSIPWMTYTLIFLNTVIFFFWMGPDFFQAILYDEIDPYVRKVWTYGFRGSSLEEAASIGAFTTFTSMFMHADPSHLFGNMFYLYTFGNRIEDACGPWRYLSFYLLAGMIANLGSTLINPSSVDLPSIGASGAISGVMGAYLILFPGKRIVCLWGIGSIFRFFWVGVRRLLGQTKEPIWTWTVTLPAVVLLVGFAILNVIPSLTAIQEGQGSGTNYLAHLAGFLGALTIFMFVRKDLLVRYTEGRLL